MIKEQEDNELKYLMSFLANCIERELTPGANWWLTLRKGLLRLCILTLCCCNFFLRDVRH